MRQLTPVVGYVGGKRRLLPFLRPYLPLGSVTRYVEPFVGMGAVYLDLRASGFTGPSVLADRNTYVVDFWRAVHDRQLSAWLVDAAEGLSTWSATEDGFWRMMGESCSGVERTARGLWLTNFMYANLPPDYVGNKWVAPRSSGTKLKSAAKWNKTFPWGPCVERLRSAVAAIVGLPCEVVDDGPSLLATLGSSDTVYADPPYFDRASYKGNGRSDFGDYVTPVFASRAGRIVLTETGTFDVPTGWTITPVSVLSRQAGPWNGAGTQRKENIYANFSLT